MWFPFSTKAFSSGPLLVFLRHYIFRQYLLIILSYHIPSSNANIMNTPSSTPSGFSSFPGLRVASAVPLAPAAPEKHQICFLCPDTSSQEESFTLTAGGRDPGFIALAELWQVWARLGDLLGFWVRTSVNTNTQETCKSSSRGFNVLQTQSTETVRAAFVLG